MATKKLTDADLKNAKAKGGARLELWDANTPGLCLRVSQSRKAWLVRYRADGKQRRYVFGEYPDVDLVDARAQAAQILRDARKDGADPARDRERKRAEVKAQPIKTFRNLAEAYVEACESGHWKPRGKPQSARTLKDLRESLDRYILPELGELPLADVTRQVVKRFLRAMAARGIAAQTNKAISAIRRIYNWAIVEYEGKLVPVNVAAHHPKEVETPRARTLTDPELKAIWAALKAPQGFRVPPLKPDDEDEVLHLSRPMAILLQLAALLLQRPKELSGIMASELNLEQATWLIPAARMKARKPHLVPLPPRAVELLREALQLAEFATAPAKPGERRPNDFPLFPSPRDRTRPIRSGSMAHTMKDVLRAVGLNNVVLYDLRRTGSTALTSERIGVSPFIRSLVLSHTTDTGGGASVSAKHYDANSYIVEKRRALEAWEGLLLEIVGERKSPTNAATRMAGASA